MNEFENVDVRQWVRDGLVMRARSRIRRFGEKRIGSSAIVRIAVAAMAVVGVANIVTSVSATQIQDRWALSVLPSAPPTSVDLVGGAPETHWSGLIAAVSSWPDLDDDAPIDFPPLV